MELSNLNFNYNGSAVRTLIDDMEIWFCLKDVLKSLEVKDFRTERLETKGLIQNHALTNGGLQKLTFINEPNLYRVIFRSDKPEATKFQNWVFETVLPSIRKNGSYLSDKDKRKIELWDLHNKRNTVRTKMLHLITADFGNMTNFATLTNCNYDETRKAVSGYRFSERVCKAIKNEFNIDIKFEHTGERMFEELELPSTQQISGGKS
ncbi:MAG: hypothetical protein KDK45_23785 [Leptospiraceae bacterium]|nr:hypothetical protein [Leptospiraceae bacterium]